MHAYIVNMAAAAACGCMHILMSPVPSDCTAIQILMGCAHFAAELHILRTPGWNAVPN